MILHSSMADELKGSIYVDTKYYSGDLNKDNKYLESQSVSSEDMSMRSNLPMYDGRDNVNPQKNRYPHCIVWTPIPLLTWLFPIIGHMGIATTAGVIRDFAGPYYVSEDDMAFGDPTKYWQLDLGRVKTGGRDAYDRAVADASDVYKGRMHNLCCDNCHSHVALALNTMKYNSSSSWNMVKLCFLMCWHSSYVSFCGFLKTWLPFVILVGIIVGGVLIAHHT